MGEDAETQGLPHQGGKLRTWKVTGLSGEVLGLGAQGRDALGGTGSQYASVHAVRALHAVRLHCTPSRTRAGTFCVWICACVAFARRGSLSGPPGGRGRLLKFKELGQRKGGIAQLQQGFLGVLRPLVP